MKPNWSKIQMVPDAIVSRRHMSFGKILVLMMVVFLLGACSGVSAIEIGEDAPEITLRDMDGKSVNLSDFKGKVIILDFFATWCPPCRQEIPDFIELQRTYNDKGFTMVAVSLVSLEEAKDFARKVGINYPVLIDDGKASATYGPVRSIPTTYVIGKDFKIAKIYIGYRPKDIFENDIKELLR